jgi:hypothetical protein
MIGRARKSAFVFAGAFPFLIAASAHAQEAAPTPVTPPTPPAWTSAPTSFSGSELMPPTAAANPSGSSDAVLEARLSDLEARLHEDEHKMREQSHQPWWVTHLNFTGYLQPQLLIQAFNAAASPNIQSGQSTLPAGIGANDVTATANGTTTNKDYFRLRRARLKLEATPNEYTKMVFEIDPNLSGTATPGSGTIARNIEAIGIAKWTKDWDWHTEFGMGIFKVPFDPEITQIDADRPFIERSWGEQNMFPSEFDMGIRQATFGFHKKLRVDFAVVNGTTIGEPTFSVVPDLNKSKDVVGKATWDFGPVEVGVGAYYGQGAETDATTLRFKQFPRWAGNANFGVHHDFVKVLGTTKLIGEIVLAKNMDRGVNYGKGIGLPTIPTDVANGFLQDHDERSLFIRLEQDLSRWFTVGVRYDFYSPDTAQKNDARDTYAFVGVVHFTRWLQWMIEFDHAIDNVHTPGAQAPSKQIESFSNVLQARF